MTPLVTPLVTPKTYREPDADPLAVFHSLVKGANLAGFSNEKVGCSEDTRRCSADTDSLFSREKKKRSGSHPISHNVDTCNNTWYKFAENDTCNGGCQEDTCKTSVSDTLVSEDGLLLIDDKSFPNDDTLDDDDGSLVSLNDWDDEEHGVIFCEESVGEFLPVEDFVSDLHHGDVSLESCKHGDRPARESKIWKFLGLLFVLLLARIGYNAWILVQLHASGSHGN